MENYGGFQNKMDYAKAPEFTNTYTREQYGWLCDLINQYGDKKGLQLIGEKFEKTQDLTAKAMAALLQPLVNCANLLVAYTAQLTLPAWSLLSNLLRIRTEVERYQLHLSIY